MTRPSRLYKLIGLTKGELFSASVGIHDVSSRIVSLALHRGGDEPSRFSASTASIATTANIRPAGANTVKVQISEDAQRLIADATETDPATIRNRFLGRVATTAATDTRTGWRGTELTASSWAALLHVAQETWNGLDGRPLAYAANLFGALPWLPQVSISASDIKEVCHDNEAYTASQWLRLLEDHGYIIRILRFGKVDIVPLERLRTTAAAAAVNTWPLARHHVLAPITWEQQNEFPIEYAIEYRDSTGALQATTTAPGGIPTGEAKVETLDWTQTRQMDEQWRRVLGMRRSTRQQDWRLPKVSARLDMLIGSPETARRRAAGMLLSLNVGDWVPLAGDWPPGIRGLHLVTAIEESITADGWLITLSLVPHLWIEGEPSPPVKPRTWAQATSTWGDHTSETWTNGAKQ